MSNQTVQALRQAVFTRLTVPPLTYSINGAAPITLPVANVFPRSVWQIGSSTAAQVPATCIAFDVAVRREQKSRSIDARILELRVWSTSTTDGDEATAVYEAMRALLHRADASIVAPGSDLSRAAGSGTLPITVSECIEERSSPLDFEQKTSRWYIMTTFRVIAQ